MAVQCTWLQVLKVFRLYMVSEVLGGCRSLQRVSGFRGLSMVAEGFRVLDCKVRRGYSDGRVIPTLNFRFLRF